MPRVKNKSKPLESNILSENVSQQKLDDGKAREINQKVILKQLKEFRKKDL